MPKPIVTLKQPQHLLNRLLEEPELVRIVQQMDSGVLHKVIEHIGLEDAGEIIALTTTDQLKSIFDEDLWKSDRPGKDETFDAERFGLWLEMMNEVSESFAARKLMELDDDFVILALCRHLFVLDMDALMMRMSGGSRSCEDNLVDKALESALALEWDEYHIISKNHRSWDNVIAVILELDKEDHTYLSQLLERICHISTEYIEDNGGLYNVLTADEMFESDLAAERESRREQQGYVTPSSAASFLAQVGLTSMAEILSACQPDHITRMYFRELDQGTKETGPPAVSQTETEPPPRKLMALYEELREAEILPPSRTPLLENGTTQETERVMAKAIRYIADRDELHFNRCLAELNYLANVLISGAGMEGRRYRPIEAAEKVMALCNAGAERMLGIDPDDKSPAVVEQVAGLLEKERLVKFFQVGWKLEITKRVTPGGR